MKVTAAEFQAECLRYLDEVSETQQPLEISKHGIVVAVLQPPKSEKPWERLRGKFVLHGEPEDTVIDESDIEALK